MDTAEIPVAIEPVEWFIVFHRTAVSPIFRILAVGEFKHVSAFGYCAGFKAWLLYDVQWKGTRVRLLSADARGKQVLMDWTQDCDLVRITRSNDIPHLSSRFGFYCVTAVKHLLGLKCVAVTPTQLYRHVLKHGGVLIGGRRRQRICAGAEPATLAGRSEPAAGAGPSQ